MKFSGKFGWALAATVCLALGGCAAPPLRPEPVSAIRQAVDRFELEGRLAASSGDRVASVGLLWRHGPVGDEMSFIGPLGQTLGQLSVTPVAAVLTGADGKRRRAASPEELLEQALGLRLPIGQVALWVQAVVGPSARLRRLDELGRPASVADEGWIIDYLEYASDAGNSHPRKLEAAWGDARIKLIVDRWSPGS
ncbi:MAG: lipoprotein insertase outer membrane protein LolB [Rhodocyclaceae bacterium]|jgi:outer membrane lipoprotein LolB|nr:lipoprotein insertase outer membrane protein LolB [Rhodocyclaceae bacterium]